MSTERTCDVLVVGAGPTGLVAAGLLARSGVKVRLVEKRMEATRESRAFAIQARTLELLQSLGLDRAFLARGVHATSVNIHVKGKFVGGLDFSRAQAADTPYPMILMLPQSETEELLSADLEEHGVRIERGVELQGYRIEGDDCVAELSGRDGSQESVRCGYIVGADGSRSQVRQSAGIKWDGELLPQRFLLADCRVEWPFDHERFRVFVNGPLIGLFLPLKGAACSRVMATDLSGKFGDEDGSTPAPLDLEEMQAGLAKALNLPVKLSDPVWVTRYRAHHRFVDRYSEGHAFVAGDAAHIHSPAGGQGMNTGMQDAANLAWKLAAALRGADSAILLTYDAERRPVGEAVVKRTGRLFAAAAGQAGIKAKLRDRLLPILLPFISSKAAFQTKAFLNASQRAIGYPADGLVVDAGARSPSGINPGDRMPDAGLPDGGTLLQRLSGYRFTVLGVSLDEVDAGLADAVEAGRRALLAIDPRCEPVIIGSAAPGSDLARRLGLGARQRHMLYVIRPDGYVAWRGTVSRAGELLEWISRLNGAHARLGSQPALPSGQELRHPITYGN